MQYIGYDYAKNNNIIGDVIYAWLIGVPDLNIHTKGKVIKDWREEKVCLNIGDRSPDSVVPRTIDDWTKQQADKRFHKSAYTKAYLRGYFKI